MIRWANSAEIPKILQITKACAHSMIERGILQWNESYPNQEQFAEDIRRNELYVYIYNEEVIGCIVITSLKDSEYEPIQWLTSELEHYYIHRLAVHPDHQGKGYARKLMDFAERKGREDGVASIRLDTFSKNPRNQHFYKQRGYLKVGHIFLPNQSEYPFYCFELPLINEPGKSSP
ncbi:GNAT family N-acetyltransferase [Aureitalea marina]|uniref:GNAT family N-acetyltransferase n=1 Tax=Aureitalea marina TaxID=930804 RepID=A0A2S7KS19_9FLAO|nr:GNAT family N-acetyltransferase [Aureitalea marina]PQB05397.1 GNAT family N-acetyltransferase [Aureitalea marina]